MNDVTIDHTAKRARIVDWDAIDRVADERHQDVLGRLHMFKR